MPVIALTLHYYTIYYRVQFRLGRLSWNLAKGFIEAFTV